MKLAAFFQNFVGFTGDSLQVNTDSDDSRNFVPRWQRKDVFLVG